MGSFRGVGDAGLVVDALAGVGLVGCFEATGLLSVASPLSFLRRRERERLRLGLAGSSELVGSAGCSVAAADG